jgi:hypothetical protein
MIADFVEELRRDYGLEFTGDSELEGVGFRILGGRWISKEQFWTFKGVPEFDALFGKLETAEEDAALPLSRGQAEFAQIFRDLYRGVFARVEGSGRTLIQSSDVREALRESVDRALQRRRDRDDGGQ